MTLSAVDTAGIWMPSMRTPVSWIIIKPIGSTFTAAPLPPQTDPLPEASLPPEAKPKETLETGIRVDPSGVVMGSPTTVFESTMVRIFSIAPSIMSPIGFAIFSYLPFV